jgi:predicted dithiol-disulfide oxidoreductase (DUF899 family)
MTTHKVGTREEWLAARGELLLVYHFMFGPAYAAGCPVCSSAADTFNGAVPHMNARDVTFTGISRAPLEKLQAYKRRMGWSFPWASSYGSDYNFDLEISRPEDATRELLLDRAPLGRNEGDQPQMWMRRHDEYGPPSS